MSQFEPAFEFMVVKEDATKSWAVHSDNNGGQVIAGINSKSFPNQYAAVFALPQSSRGPAIAQFYADQFWNPMRLASVNSQELAARLLDFAVNAGARTSIRILQQAINNLSAASVTVDGVLGPSTLSAANNLNESALLAKFKGLRADYYKKVASKNPADEIYLAGWLKRAEA